MQEVITGVVSLPPSCDVPDALNLYGARRDREEGKETRKIVRELSMKGEAALFSGVGYL